MTILTLGSFDIGHYGHILFFNRCKKLAGDDQVYVGLNTDSFIKLYKKKPPIMNYSERERFINSLGIYNVIPNNQPDGTIKNIINKLMEKDVGQITIVIGSDWLKKPYLKQIGLTPDDIENYNLSLMYIPYTYGISTTEIKRRLTA